MNDGSGNDRRIGMYEALAQELSARFMPGLVGTIAKGYARAADIATYPSQYLFDVESAERRAEKLDAFPRAMHRSAAGFAHTGTALIETGLDVAFPLRMLADATSVDVTKPLRDSYKSHTAAADKLAEGGGLADSILSGVLGLPAMALEVGAAGAVLGPAALPALMGLKASRDPGSGDFTGLYETGKGALAGAAMHRIGVGSSKQASLAKRLGYEGGGFAGITAIQGGSNEDIATSFALGAGMGAMRGRTPGRQRDLVKEAEDWSAKNINMMDREYARLGQSHALVNGLKQAEERMQQPQVQPENGVPRAFDFEPRPLEPGTYRPTGPGIPDEGYPSTGIPGQAATQWQAKVLSRAIESGVNPGLWTGRLNVDRMFTSGRERLAAVKVLNQHGGPQAFYGAHRGKVPWEETIHSAQMRVGEMMGEMPEQTIARVRNGGGFDEVELAATEMVLHARSAKLDAASKAKYEGRPGADEAFTKAATEYVASMYAMTGQASKAGRTLNILGGRHWDLATKMKRRAVADVIERYGGSDNIGEINAIMASLRNPADVMRVLRQEADMASQGKVYRAAQVWKAGLLSAFSTQMANVKGNIAKAALTQLVEQPLAVAWGAAKAPIQRGISRGLGERDYARAMREDPTNLQGAVDKYALGQSKPAFLAEHRQDLIARRPGLDPTDRLYAEEAWASLQFMAESHAFALDAVAKTWKSGKEFSPSPGFKTNAAYDTAHSRERNWIPFKALTAGDALFGAGNYYSSLGMQGWREARQRGVPLMERAEYARQFIREVHDPLVGTPNARLNELRGHMKKALDFSNVEKFTNPLGTVGKGLVKWRGTSPFIEFVLTFLQVPINVSKQGFYRSPLGFVAPKMASDLTAAFRKEAPDQKNVGKRQNEALALMTSGGLMGLMVYDQVMQGNATGATPTDEGDRELQRSMGITPMSMKVQGAGGDSLMQSYARLEPIATPIAIWATLFDAHSKGKLSTDDLMGAAELVAGAYAEVVVNRSTLQGSKKFAEAVTEPGSKMGPYLEQMISSVIPAMSASFARGEDPFRRDQSGLPEAVWARLPRKARTPELARRFGFGPEMLRESLPIMYDLVGRPMQIGDPAHESLARMFDEYQTPLTPHPLLDAMAVSGAGLRRVSKMVTIRPKDMWSNADPDLTALGHSLQKELHIEMTPTQREWVNGGANKAAADELTPIIPNLMRDPNLMREISLDALLGRGVPAGVVSEMRSAGIGRAAVIDAVRDLFRSSYGRHRNQYIDAVIDQWRKEGKLRKEVEKQLTVENRLQQYRIEHGGGGR